MRSYAWERIRIFARRYGADIIPVSWNDIHAQLLGADVEYAPFNSNLAVHWNDKKVFAVYSRMRAPSTVGGIIHELGHVLAVTERPKSSNEYLFVGWESLVSKLTDTRRHWLCQMGSYTMNFNEKWGNWSTFSWAERHAWLKISIERGLRLGNIDGNYLPTAVR